jgi:hypothetical protein
VFGRRVHKKTKPRLKGFLAMTRAEHEADFIKREKIAAAETLLRNEGYSVRAPSKLHLPCVVYVDEVDDARSTFTLRTDALMNGTPFHVLRRFRIEELAHNGSLRGMLPAAMTNAIAQFIAGSIETAVSGQVRDLLSDVVCKDGEKLDYVGIGRLLRAKIRR